MSQPKVQRSPLSNHKGKEVAVVVICANSKEDEEERPALLVATITTLQRSYRFKNLFDQLELTANEQSLSTGVECLAVKVRANKAFLQDTNEITFNDEDMKVGYSNHRKPLYLATPINQIPVKRALVDTGALVNLILLSTL